MRRYEVESSWNLPRVYLHAYLNLLASSNWSVPATLNKAEAIEAVTEVIVSLQIAYLSGLHNSKLAFHSY